MVGEERVAAPQHEAAVRRRKQVRVQVDDLLVRDSLGDCVRDIALGYGVHVLGCAVRDMKRGAVHRSLRGGGKRAGVPALGAWVSQLSQCKELRLLQWLSAGCCAQEWKRKAVR